MDYDCPCSDRLQGILSGFAKDSLLPSRATEIYENPE
jgi:hypothetical protein